MPLKQNTKRPLNSIDCLMMVFDYQMRKNGFAGNHAQVVLGLPRHLPETDIRRRINRMVKQFPILKAVMKRHACSSMAHWRVKSNDASPYPKVGVHREKGTATGSGRPGKLKQRLFNTPLNPEDGEQIRFDLIYYDGGRMEIIMTWIHALMDAQGAEYLLAMVGHPDIEEQAASALARENSPNAPLDNLLQGRGLKDKIRMAVQAFDRIDEIALNPPASFFPKQPDRSSSVQEYETAVLRPYETETVGALAKKTCGLFNETAFFVAATVPELQRLYAMKGLATGNFVLTMPVSIRKKGTVLPVFSNHSTSFLYEFNANEAADRNAIATGFKRQTQWALTNGLVEATLALMDLSKYMPAWLYIRKIRQAMKGEIASMVFANTGSVFSRLDDFMGVPVDYLHHIPVVIVPPGLGLFFYQHKKQLGLSLVYAGDILSPDEAGGFLKAVQTRLMTGDPAP